jgi:hypothetical protein
VFNNQDDIVQEDEDMIDDLPSERENAGATVNMGSVVTNPRIVNNNTKMPAVETSKLGTAAPKNLMET